MFWIKFFEFQINNECFNPNKVYRISKKFKSKNIENLAKKAELKQIEKYLI